jgi:hypothetical protein
MVVHSPFQYISLSTQQWLLLAPDRPCYQHVQSTRRMSLTVKRPSTQGSTFQVVMSPPSNHVCSTARLAARPVDLWPDIEYVCVFITAGPYKDVNIGDVKTKCRQ